jgi:YbbR domain-containing protein
MRIFRNYSYKIAALLVASLLWASAQGIRSVEQSLDIPISLEEIPDEVVVVGSSASEVNVRIVGSRAAVRRAARQLTRYPLSLRGLKPGEARIAVEVERLTLPRGARVTARSPSTVAVRLEPREQKRVRVRPDVVGEAPEGFRLVSVEVEPKEVILEGARGELRRIQEVLTDRIELGTLPGPTEEEVRLSLGSPYIWRAEGGQPVRVRIKLESIPAPEDGAGARRAVRPTGEDLT